MSVVDEVKDRVDIVEIVGETVKLRKSGKNYTGFCPFHANKRTPAFAVFPDSGTWRCFGSCNEGGDAFSFLMKKEGWDFKETLRYLADRVGVEMQPLSPAQEAAEETHQRLRDLLEAAVTFYRHNLLQTPAGSAVLEYLHKRGMSDATLEAFQIGYAPDSWDAASNYLAERGYTGDELIQAGMVTEREQGGTYDRFRGRLMIPIRDVRGRLAGFGARVMDPEAYPKYVNSPQSPIFDKGRLLYGLDRARKAIRQQDQAVLVEGYMDVIGLWQAGFENVVSPMGTAITEHQLRSLKKYSRRIILALDADAAGSQATIRGLTLAREALDREADPVFDTRGLVRYEGRLDADIRIVTLPVGKDPDEIVGEDREAWPALLGQAKTVVDYVLDVMSAERDLDDPKAKSEIARQVLPLIEDVADSVERETYRQKLARRLRVDERALREMHTAPARAQGRPRTGLTGETAPFETVDLAMERFCLGALLKEPEILYRIDRELHTLNLERLTTKDFTGSDRRVIFQAVRSALGQDEEEPARFWRKALDPALSEDAEGLYADVADLDFRQPRVINEVLANFLRLRKRNLEAYLSQLRFRIQAAQDGDAAPVEGLEGEVWEHTREVQQLATKKERLDQALARPGGFMSESALPGER
jgi:DNA primase